MQESASFQSTNERVNARVVPTGGFGGAAGFSVFKMWVQVGTACPALTKACPRSVAKSFLHVGDVVVRRQDTFRTCVQVAELLVGDMRVAQVFDPRNLLPRPLGEECVLQARESIPVRQP